MTILNTDGSVQTRYAFRDIPMSEWEAIPKECYKIVRENASPSGKIHSYRVVYKTTLSPDWIEDKNRSGVFCQSCYDQGVTRKDGRAVYCKFCDLGEMAKRHFQDSNSSGRI